MLSTLFPVKTFRFCCHIWLLSRLEDEQAFEKHFVYILISNKKLFNASLWILVEQTRQMNKNIFRYSFMYAHICSAFIFKH